MAWWREGGWTGRGTYLGPNKEVFDAEVFAILQAVKLFSERNEEGQAYTAFSDSQAAVARIQHSDCGPAQALARAAIDWYYELRQRGNTITVRWTLTHVSVEWDEHADAMAKRAAEGEEDRAVPEYPRASPLHLTRKTTEARSEATSE